MTKAQTDKAIAECKRFLAACNAIKWQKWAVGSAETSYGKECAAAKRSSLDLTRALAEMRRS